MTDKTTTQTASLPLCYQKVNVRELLYPDQESYWEDRLIEINGWIYASRIQGQGTFGFISIMDNTSGNHAQVVLNADKYEKPDELSDLLSKLKKGSVVTVKGQVVPCPVGNNVEQKIEIMAHSLVLYGIVDSAVYPIAKQNIPLDTLRLNPHLRIKTKHFTTIAIIRNTASMLCHTFFQRRDFHWVHTPILTSNDCEGAGETFQVYSDKDKQIIIDREIQKLNPPIQHDTSDDSTHETTETTETTVQPVKSKSQLKKERKLLALGKSIEHLQLVEKIVLAGPKTFFNDKKVCLTVSGQLHGEAFAHALQKIYTFGPTFRADPSETTRHLAEFWMIEPEIAPICFHELMDLAEDFVRDVVKGVISKHLDELVLLEKLNEKEFILMLQKVVSEPFQRISYTDAIKLLLYDLSVGKLLLASPNMTDRDIAKLQKSRYVIRESVYWGMDLKSEHERYLTDVVFQKPVIIYHYPKSLKPFYMKESNTKYDEGVVVDAMDLLFPGLGELIGGSMREDDYNTLKATMDKNGLSEDLEWYLDLRRFGSVPHGGFGLGFERLIMILTGSSNIKDVIGFPRFSHNCFA